MSIVSYTVSTHLMLDAMLWFRQHAINMSLTVDRPVLRWWTDLSCAVFHVDDDLFLPLLSRLADGRRADVWCCARGGRGCAAVSADHCQLITVQPTQALALWEPLHGPHQRGRCASTRYLLCLLSQHTEHRHTEHICSQGSRRRQSVNKSETVNEEGI